MDDVIRRLQAELDRLNTRAIRLEHQFHEADEDRRALARAITILNRNASRTSTPLPVTAVELQGMTQEEAVVLMADRSGGILRFGPAKRLLLDARLIQNPKNAATILYSILQRSGRFERVSRGEYRLLDQGAPAQDEEESPWLVPLPGRAPSFKDELVDDREAEMDGYSPSWGDVAEDPRPSFREVAG